MLSEAFMAKAVGNRVTEDRILSMLKDKKSRSAYLSLAEQFLDHGKPQFSWRILRECVESTTPHCLVTQALIQKTLDAGAKPDCTFPKVDSSPVKVSVVICSWNRAEMLKKCLEEIKQKLSSHEGVEILVVDNGSTDNSVQVARAAGVTQVYAAQVNAGLEIYRNAFDLCQGELIIEVDDDVIELPENFDQIFLDYFEAYPDYGFLGMNVVQDERTNGAKPGLENYTEDCREEKVIERGPVVGCCAAIRRTIFDSINRFEGVTLSMSYGEDRVLCSRVISVGLGVGIIRDAKCLHASGPYFSREFGYLERDVEKYRMSGMTELAEMYERML